MIKHEIKKAGRVRDKRGKLWVVQAVKADTLEVASKGQRRKMNVNEVDVQQER